LNTIKLESKKKVKKKIGSKLVLCIKSQRITKKMNKKRSSVGKEMMSQKEEFDLEIKITEFQRCPSVK
jgi:hypothetical protein